MSIRTVQPESDDNLGAVQSVGLAQIESDHSAQSYLPTSDLVGDTTDFETADFAAERALIDSTSGNAKPDALATVAGNTGASPGEEQDEGTSTGLSTGSASTQIGVSGLGGVAGDIGAAGTLSPAAPSPSSLSYPFNDVVYIWDNLNGGTRLSGVIIGPHTVLTASHGLWDSANKGQPSTIDVFPGYSGNTDPLSSATPVPGAWIDHFFEINDNDGGPDEQTKADSASDYAIIDFTGFTFSGWFGLQTGFSGGTVDLTGYPATAGFAQTNDVGTVSADGTYPVLDYGTVSSSPGNSGGPLWINKGTAANPLPYVVGVVSTSGWAVQLTASDFQTIMNWEAADGVAAPTLPDLTVNTVALGTTSLLTGVSTTISYHVENDGTATAGASVSKVYLSTDSTITTSDTLLATVNDGSVGPNGAFISDSTSITLPSGLASGTYWIGVIADANGQVSESNETDNTSPPIQVSVTAVQPPVVTNSTANQVWGEGQHLSFTLPANTFTDPQDATLTYTATSSNGGSLPSWLTFAPGTRTFSGTVPSAAQNLTIVVTATDTIGLSRSETFNATVAIATPSGTDATMLLQSTSNGALNVWDIGGNSTLVTYLLGQIGLEWQLLGVGGFNGTDTSDFIMRQSTTNALDYFDVQNSRLVAAGPMGNIGKEWQVLGFGDFSGNAGETDMLMRDTGNGAIDVFDIQHNQIVAAGAFGNIGVEWQALGFGNFSGNSGESDMLMRDTYNGAIDYFDIQHNQVVGAGSFGDIGVEWEAAGFADISGNPGESDMVMRDTGNGAFYYFDIQHNQLVAAGSLGSAATGTHVLGLAPP